MKPPEDTAALNASGPRLQYAALPFRRRPKIEILLVTSRETQRWIIPKGWPMKAKKPHATAAREALEEAGISGRVSKTSVGHYQYVKWLKSGAPLLCDVRVFGLEVSRQRKDWKEKGQRQTAWFSVEEAVAAVQEPGLKVLIRQFADSIAGGATEDPAFFAADP